MIAGVLARHFVGRVGNKVKSEFGWGMIVRNLIFLIGVILLAMVNKKFASTWYFFY
jgi:hypothetical protein